MCISWAWILNIPNSCSLSYLCNMPLHQCESFHHLFIWNSVQIVMIVFAGSASNYKNISVFLAMIAKPWTLVCYNMPSISLHLFISLFAIFPKYFRTSFSHYLRYFSNISTPLYLIICATWATANRRKQAARKEVSAERNIGKNRWKKVGAKSRLFLFSLTELFLPRPNYYSAPASQFLLEWIQGTMKMLGS